MLRPMKSSRLPGLALTTIAIVALSSRASAVNIIPNPGFESGNISPWEVSTFGVGQAGVTNQNPHSGTFAMHLGGGNMNNPGFAEARYSFNPPVPTADVNSYSFWAFSQIFTSYLIAEIQYTSGATTYYDLQTMPFEYQFYNITTFNPGTAIESVAFFAGQGQTASPEGNVDDVALDIIPEPAYAIPLLVGFMKCCRRPGRRLWP